MTIQIPSICYITSIGTHTDTSGFENCIAYKVQFFGDTSRFVFSTKKEDWKSKLSSNSEADISSLISFVIDQQIQLYLKGLIVNGKWIPSNEEVITKEYIQKLIDNNYIPKRPEEKKDYILTYLSAAQKYDGYIFPESELRDRQILDRLYLTNRNEFELYIKALESDGFIKVKYSIHGSIEYFTLTFEGLLKSNELKEEGIESTLCFVAMSFDKTDEKIFTEGIKPACEATGFTPILVNDEKRVKIKGEQDINDAIIASIKKCRFV